MKKMMYFEIKKLIERKTIIVFLILLIFNIIHIIFAHYDEVSTQFKQGKMEIVKKVEGPITQDKVTFLFEGMEKNKKLVDAGEYDSENGDKNTYTGYIYGDMNAFEEVYKDLQRTYEYANEINAKISIIDENIERSHQSDSYSLFLKNNLYGRYISSYYDTEGIQNYLNYSDSTLFIFIFIIFVGINYLYYDRNYNMEKMISIAKHGGFRLRLLRYIVLNIFIIISSFLFLLSDYICFSILYPITGLMNPIYSLSNFKFTYFDISILAFIILYIVIKLLGISCISSLMLFLSKNIKINYIVVIISFISSLFLWLYFYKTTSVFSLIYLSKIFSMHKLFSYYIHDIFLITFGICIFFLIMTILYLKKGVTKE